MVKIKVMIIDNDNDWRGLIVEFLKNQEDIDIAACIDYNSDPVGIIKSIDTDIVLLGIESGKNEFGAVMCASEINEYNKNIKLIMLSCLEDQDMILRAYSAGVLNFVDKADLSKFPYIIRTTYEAFSPVEVLIREYVRLKHEEQLKELTVAEREVYDLLEKGYTKKEIGEKLKKSQGTLKNQVRKIIRKLDVKDTKEALQKVRRSGFVYQYK